MSDLDNSRIQQDARRTVAERRSAGSSTSAQAMIRHLGVELYKERHHDELPAEPPDDQTDR